jgi:hypothetical protein
MVKRGSLWPLGILCAESTSISAVSSRKSQFNNQAQSVIRGQTLTLIRLGRQSRDMGLFKDDDGKGYLLTEDVCAPDPIPQ